MTVKVTVHFNPLLMLKPPKVGQEIYFPTTDYNHGGLGTVGRIQPGISAGEEVPFVTCAEAPGVLFNWESLREEQEALKRSYGNSRARPCSF